MTLYPYKFMQGFFFVHYLQILDVIENLMLEKNISQQLKWTFSYNV